MRALKTALLVSAAIAVTAAQAPDPVLSETRLSVHTLLREDVFAAFIGDNVERLARAEQNIEFLLKERPGQRANLLAWKGGASMYRAVVAHESARPDEFARFFADAGKEFAAAASLASPNDGVAAITGGTLSIFADRLPEAHRAAAWSQAYDAYSILWKQQGPGIEQMPVHFKGELLAGLAQSAQRTGRTDEATAYLDKILAVLPNTPYEPMARQWKADPSSAATTTLTCKNCHNAGRLSARLAALNK